MEYYIFALDNIHCQSCQESIVRVLEPIVPSDHVLVDIAEKTVTVAVPTRTEDIKNQIIERLYNAGFDVIMVDDHGADTPFGHSLWDILWGKRKRTKKHHEYCKSCQDEKRQRKSTSSSATGEKNGGSLEGVTIVDSAVETQLYRVIFSIGGMTCAACQNSVSAAVSDQLPEVTEFGVDLLTKSGMAVVDDKRLANRIQQIIEDVGYDCEVVEIVPLEKQASDPEDEHNKLFKVSASLGGMTCASCVNAVNEQVKLLPFIKSFNVSLMNNSAEFVITEPKVNVDKIKNAIEDAGYEFSVVSIMPVVTVKSQSRTVNLSVTGMFCGHCPERINEVFSSYGNAVTVDDPITMDHPYIKFTYIPNPPQTTIRTILNNIKAISPEFSVEIVHPITLEERSKQMAAAERKKILYRAIFSVVAAIPTFILGIVGMSLLPKTNSFRVYLDEPLWVGSVSRVTWAMFIISTFVYFYSANVFHIKAYKEITSLWRPGTSWRRRLFKFGSMNLLMSLGTTISYFASIALLILAAHSENSTMAMQHHGQGGYTTTYFDSVVFLTMFLLLGRLLEAFSKAKTASAVSLLGKLRPDTVHLVENYSGPGQQTESSQVVSIDLIEAGDYIKILPGMSPPADSIVVEGKSSWDESALTGESLPVEHGIGQQIYAGTINTGGVPVIAKVVAVEGSSMLDQIVEAVRQGQLHRAPIERVADRITGVFVPFVTLIAIITWVVWLGLGLSGKLPESYLDIEVGGWTVWALQFAIAVFVVACPCGIGLAAPTALFVGTGLAAKYGILAKGGGEAFQEGSRIDVICFDKTGTLTEGGEPKVTHEKVIFNNNGDASISENLPLRQIARDLELSSTHPLGIAIRNHVESDPAKNIQNPILVSQDLTETSGRGLKGSILHHHLTGNICEALIGSEKFMRENVSDDDHTLDDESIHAEIHEWKQQGNSIVFVGVRFLDDTKFKPALVMAVADKIRDEAPFVIKKLQSMGIETWMITGDNHVTAAAVAAQVNIPENQVIAEVLPSQKADKIKFLQKTLTSKRNSGRAVVAMVGDGINDAPSLSAADVGIAIGSGSDIALSSAKFVLLQKPTVLTTSGDDGETTEVKADYLSSILTLIDLSRTVFRRIKFNFAWALVYNCVAIPIAAGVIYPYKNSRLDPVWAALAMALSSVSVITSSLLLKFYKPPSISKI